jgi:hypothetical protein
MALSARGYDRVRKVARTIADLADDDTIAADHIAKRCSSAWSNRLAVCLLDPHGLVVAARKSRSKARCDYYYFS